MNIQAAQTAISAPHPVNTNAAPTAEKAKAVGKQFESMFMSQMLQHMFDGIGSEEGMFGGGHAEAMFRPMLLDEYAKMITDRSGGIGLADQVAKTLLKNQEV
jgi:peptidoglycan hydrolase FlgJ